MEFVDGTNAEIEYEYDENGNLTKDLNKNVLNIEYNCLDLPCKVTFEDGNTIEYVYAADGTKLQTVHKIDGETTTRDYCGNAIYENGELKMLLNDYGYVSFPDRKFHFYLKDHQGNVRVVADADGNVEEVNDYYPFGGLMSSTTGNNSQPYKYNGKELDRKAGLNLYDYGARFYDPAIGRFSTVDPMSEEYSHLTPYNYCDNDPMNRIDPDGMQSRYNWEKKRYEDENGNEVSWEAVVAEYNLDGGPDAPDPKNSLDDFGKEDESSSIWQVDAVTGAAMRITPGDFSKYKSVQPFQSSVPIAPAVPVSVGLGGLSDWFGAAFSKALGIVAVIFTLQGDTSPDYAKRIRDNGKNEKHGDGGRALSKEEKRIGELQDEVRLAPNKKEQKKLQKKLQNIRQNGERKRKGEEHSRGNKR